MDNYDDITAARQLLELPERATMQMIKSHYRRLLAQWHPDRCREGDVNEHAEKTRQIIAAYRLLAGYCSEYEYSFSRESVERNLSAEQWWLRRFGKAPLWGDCGGSDD